MPKKGSFEKKIRKKNSSLTILLSSSTFFPKKISSKHYYNITSLPWAPAFFYQSASFASPNTKPDEPCQWIMPALKDAFWGPRTP
jgi:hypothetical protein